MSNFHPNRSVLRDSVSSSFVKYYSLPSNFITQSIETVTRGGATATATVTPAGPFDQIAVTGGDKNSRIIINSTGRLDSMVTLRMKVLVNSVNTTPLLGISFAYISSTEDTDAADKGMWLNPLTGVVTRFIRTSSGTTAPSVNSGGTFVAAGNVVEIEYILDIRNATERFNFQNLSTGTFVSASVTNMNINDGSGDLGGFGPLHQSPALILADGTYTILDFTIESRVAQNPKLMLIGDSLSTGYNITSTDTLYYKLMNDLPYNVVVASGLGNYIYGMAKRSPLEIMKMRPKAVLVVTYLSFFYTEYRSGNANNAIFMAAFNSIINSIIAVGAVPLLIKVDSWPLQADVNACPDWNTFVDAQIAIYPQIKVVDLRGITYTYDSSTYHYDGPMNIIFKNKIIQTLANQNLI